MLACFILFLNGYFTCRSILRSQPVHIKIVRWTKACFLHTDVNLATESTKTLNDKKTIILRVTLRLVIYLFISTLFFYFRFKAI